MERLSNAAMTMLMCLALQAACLRRTHKDKSVAQVTVQRAFFINNTLQHSEVFYDSSGAEETTNATIVNTSTFRTNIVEAENEMDITRDFKHGQASDDFELESDVEGFVQPSLSTERNCLGKTCIYREGARYFCEYLKKGTKCAFESFMVCRNDPGLDICKLNGSECRCDPKELDAGLKKKKGRQYRPLEIIYSGKFGTVVKVADLLDENGDDVLLAKMIPPESPNVPVAGKIWYVNEAEMQEEASRISHGVPRMYEAWENRNTGIKFFIQDYVDGEDFVDFVTNKQKAREMNDVLVFKLFRQLAVTVSELHELRDDRRIVHRDIKLQNLKYDEETENLWLLDFGFASYMEENQTVNNGTELGTPGYMAPEIYLSQKRYLRQYQEFQPGYNEKVDIFAMGVVLYILVFGFPPWNDEGPKSLKQAIKTNGIDAQPSYEWPTPGNWTTERFEQVKELLQVMLAILSDKRPTAEEVVSIMDGDLGVDQIGAGQAGCCVVM